MSIKDQELCTCSFHKMEQQLQVLKEEGNHRDHLHIGERVYRVEDVGILIDTLQASQDEVERLRKVLQEISKLDYTRAAVNCCASTAVSLAKAALKEADNVE